MIDRTLKWPLMTSKPLRRWVSKSGKLVILGDAAHVMVPYMSQGDIISPTPCLISCLHIHAGAAMAVEDGAALAEALRHAYSAEDIIPALKVYQDVRIKRSSQMQQASLVNGVVFHFPDGPEQEARDAAMRAEVEGRVFTESPNQWSDPTTQAWAYGYDAVGAIADAFREAELQRSMAESNISTL
jgi:salicylate hydroxylase